MNLLKLFVLQLEEHDFEHLLLTLVARSTLTMFEVLHWRDDDLLADSLENWLALKIVCVFDEVRHLLYYKCRTQRITQSKVFIAIGTSSLRQCLGLSWRKWEGTSVSRKTQKG